MNKKLSHKTLRRTFTSLFVKYCTSLNDKLTTMNDISQHEQKLYRVSHLKKLKKPCRSTFFFLYLPCLIRKPIYNSEISTHPHTPYPSGTHCRHDALAHPTLVILM